MGALGTLLLNLPLALGAWWLARDGLRLGPGLSGALGAIVIAWTWLTVGLEALGSLGLLYRQPLAIWSLGLLIAGVVARARRAALARPDVATGTGAGWTWSEAVALGCCLIPAALLGTQSLFGPVKVVSDGPIYHLYFAARWWRAGRLELVAAPFGENAATYFPAVGDLWFTWLIVGWGGDRLARVGQAPFLMAAGVACFAMARRLGSSRRAALVAVAWFVTCFPLVLFSFEPNVDTIFIAGYMLAGWFFLAFALGDLGAVALFLGGLAAGLAWATKPTGTVFVPPLLGLGVVAAWVRPGRPRQRLTRLAVLVLAPWAPAGFWFGRNAWLTGNPLYPLDLPALGWIGWYGSDVMRQSYFYIPRADLAALGDILLVVVDPRLALLWTAAMLGAWMRWRGTEHARLVWVCALLAAANVAMYWLFVPYRTQQRFFLQAMGLAAVPLARLLDRSRVLLWLAVGLLVVHVLTPETWPFLAILGELPWKGGTSIPVPVVSLLTAAPDRLGARWAIPLLSLVVAVSGLRFLSRPTPGRAAVGVAGVACLIGVCALMVFPLAVSPRIESFYPRSFRDFYPGWIRLESASGPAGTRLAYAGTNIPYYLLGRGLRNHVRYVNIDGHRDWLMHDYHRQAIQAGQPRWTTYPRPGWDRAHPDYVAWLENLRAEGIRILVVTRVNAQEGPHNVADAQGFPIERQWAEGHPEQFLPLYGVREQDPQFRFYQVRDQMREPRADAEGGE